MAIDFYRQDKRDSVQYQPSYTYGSAPRIDWLTFHFEMEPDRYQQYYTPLSEFVEMVANANVLPFNFKQKVLGAKPADGTRIYQCYVWGHLANAVLLNLNPLMYRYLRRVDFRVETTITDGALDHLHTFLQKNAKGNRNITQYQSRARSKKAGRDAGGTGVALGSHKSDTRLIAYKRTGDVGAVEFNLANGALSKAIERAEEYYESDTTVRLFDALKFELEGGLSDMAQQCGFATLDDMFNFLNAKHDTHEGKQPSDYELKAAVKKAYEAMSDSEKRRMLRLAGWTQEDFMSNFGI